MNTVNKIIGTQSKVKNMEPFAIVLLALLFLGIAALVQSPLILGFALGVWLLNKGWQSR